MAQDFRQLIRAVPDWPGPGVTFRDITPLLAHPEGLAWAVARLSKPFRDKRIDLVAGIEARGFIFAVGVAQALGAGFVPVRKPGKLPCSTIRQDYALEYGRDAVEIHDDACCAGQRVLVVDDVLATGGTLAASCQLFARCQAEVVGAAVLIDIRLADRSAVLPSELHSVIAY